MLKKTLVIATKLLKGSVIFVMKNLTKQAVILDNLSSPYICQAILILKGQPEGNQKKIIAEAEQIVAAYFNKSTYVPAEVQKQKNTGLKAAVITLCAALGASLFMLIFK